MARTSFDINGVSVGGGEPLFLIAGPCVIESEGLCIEVATEVKRIAAELGLGFIFKSSFDKANRTSGSSFRGLGVEEGLGILSRVREQVGVPVLTDVHLPEQCAPAAALVDVLQIPAFLCRQSDLLEAAGAAARERDIAVNIKKGQFLSPWEMEKPAAKVAATGCEKILLTERGASFGYNNLVTDLRSLAIMRRSGWPIVFDGTHSAQLPGAQGDITGGMRDMIPTLVRGAVAAGVDGLFLETHPDPEKALSDSATQLRLTELPALLRQVVALDAALRSSGGPV